MVHLTRAPFKMKRDKITMAYNPARRVWQGKRKSGPVLVESPDAGQVEAHLNSLALPFNLQLPGQKPRPV